MGTLEGAHIQHPPPQELTNSGKRPKHITFGRNLQELSEPFMSEPLIKRPWKPRFLVVREASRLSRGTDVLQWPGDCSERLG